MDGDPATAGVMTRDQEHEVDGQSAPSLEEDATATVEFTADQPDRSGASAAERTSEDDSTTTIIPQRVVEAILFAADSPMPAVKIAAVLGVGDARDVRKHIEALNESYATNGNSFRIEEIAGGYQMMTLPAYNTWLTKLLRTRQETKLSPAAMETLAIVAYKQPCTRAEVEAIRGVAVGEVINRLREMNLVKIVGRAEDLGRPMLYGTTKRFLEVFGLPSLNDLPRVEALSSGRGEPENKSPVQGPPTALSHGDDSNAEADSPVTPELRDAKPTGGGIDGGPVRGSDDKSGEQPTL